MCTVVLIARVGFRIQHLKLLVQNSNERREERRKEPCEELVLATWN